MERRAQLHRKRTWNAATASKTHSALKTQPQTERKPSTQATRTRSRNASARNSNAKQSADTQGASKHSANATDANALPQDANARNAHRTLAKGRRRQEAAESRGDLKMRMSLGTSCAFSRDLETAARRRTTRTRIPRTFKDLNGFQCLSTLSNEVFNVFSIKISKRVSKIF